VRAEIGFVVEDDGLVGDRLQLVITAQSPTELTTLKMFAQRTGRSISPFASSMTVEEPKEMTR